MSRQIQFCICYICHRQIHDRKPISIRCNSVEHWVHLICAGIHLTQYTYNWSYHQPKEPRLTTHTDITPHHPYRPCLKTSLTPHRNSHTTATQTQTHVQHSPVPTGLVKPKPTPLIHSPPQLPHRHESNTYTFHTLHQLLSSHAPHSYIARQRH